MIKLIATSLTCAATFLRPVSLACATALCFTQPGNLTAGPKGGSPGKPVGHFEPIATFHVSDEPNFGEVAEIVDVTPDGLTLFYTDSEAKKVGLVDIQNPHSPVGLGVINVAGEPTSVAVTPDGSYALVCVRDPNKLVVLDLDDLHDASPIEFPLGGQPDCVAISPDGKFAGIAIENERDEEVNDGEMPQAPGGFFVIVDLVEDPSSWALREVSLTGLASRFADDPEPEFASINDKNIAAVTLQENNHIVLVDLPTGEVLRHFSAGTTTHAADLQDDDQISFTDLLENARLEPDAIAWTPNGNLVTANEGDYDLDLEPGEFTGGRNFTIFSPVGDVLFDSGAELEIVTAAAGGYNDGRSDAKGTEPEGIEIARFLNHDFLFVGMERAASVAVYRLSGNETAPKFVQVLTTGSRPEGLCVITQRGLFVTANEDDGTISIFQGKPGNP